jgi:uncharacterized protein (TIGR02118 family)
MIKIVALWTKPADVEGFEADYFENHLRIASQLPGLRDLIVSKAIGDAPYWRVTELAFASMDDLVALGASPEGQHLAEDAERLQKEWGNRNDLVFVEVEKRPTFSG